MIVYVDTSAAVKLLVDEEESAAIAAELERIRAASDTLVSSLLLHTELHCAARRRLATVDRELVAAVLSVISLVDVERSDLLTAPLLPGCLRSADAIHLATALRVGADSMAVYDAELASAAGHAGVEVLSPH